MIWIALFLGILEGLTEFLPVSSTGHLILFGELLGFEGPRGKTFEIVIQLGAILAICWIYRARLVSTAGGILRRDQSSIRFATGLLVAFLPAAFFGAMFHHAIKEELFNSTTVSIMLVLGGIAMLLAERFKPKARYESFDRLPLSLCFKIGLFQCLALIPGTSRSGATIIGALLLGVERKTAAEFSFFLAIPTMFAATLYQLFQEWHQLDMSGIHLIAVGFMAAFLSALLVVRWALHYIERHGFAVFAWYRMALGLLMLTLLA